METLTTILQQNRIDTSTFAPVVEINDFVLSAFAVHGDEAVNLWFALRDIRQQTGHWPVVLGNDNDLEFLRQEGQIHAAKRIPDIIARGLQQSPSILFTRQPDAMGDEEYEASEGYKQFKQAREQWQQAASEGIQTVAGMPDAVDPYFFHIPRDYKTDTGYPRVYVGLVHTLNTWEVPAYLRFGSWNECPSPEAHVSALKYWHDLYGVEVVGISHDVMETLASRLPARRLDAEALAFEQCQYCPDIVNQGVGTLAKLADGLQISEQWYFWWD